MIASVFGQQEKKFEHNVDLHLNDAEHPCISEEEYQRMEIEMEKNCKLLGLDNIGTNRTMQTALGWPVKPSANATDCGYYYVSAYVDMNTTSGQIQDWNCGTRTYDGHRGIDIVPWPFIWNKMDNNLAEVIAAAPGTIIAKVDGNPDRVCNGVGGGSTSNNYITVQHADGSRTLYIHMKTGSLTTKTIGQTVAAGEYLGILGSAGQSTGVHLHFEVRSDGTFANYIDPNFGTCNSGIGSSWWSNQKPYFEPELMKVSMHSKWPYTAQCPITVDTLYEQYSYPYNYGLQVAFYACTKHVLIGNSWQFKILDSTGNTVDSWSYSSPVNRNTMTIGEFRNLPTIPGNYTYQSVFLNDTCKVNFTITPPPPVSNFTTQTIKCSGQDISFTDASLNNPTAWSWTVSPNNGVIISNQNIQNPEINFINAGTYTVSLVSSNAGGTSASYTQAVTINPSITALSLTSSPAACGNSDGIINIQSQVGGTAPNMYSINNGTQQAATSFTGLTSGSYTISATDLHGCFFEETINVSSLSGPSAQVILNDSSTCNSANGVISFGATNGGSAPYTYSIDGINFSSLTSYSVAAGTYNCVVKDNNGCTFQTITTVGNIPAIIPVISQNGLTLTSSNANSYQWYLNGNIIVGQTNQNLVVTQNGAYTVETFDMNGCSEMSSIVNVNTVSVKANEPILGIKIFPNPNNGVFTISINLNESKDYLIEIRNIIGQLIHKEKIIQTSKYTKTFDFNEIGAGVYFVFIKDSEGEKMAYKVIIE